MRDALILGFIAFMLCAAMARPFLMSMAYLYVDLVSPQRVTYYLLSSVPFSMIMAVLAVLAWLMADNKKGLKFSKIQWLMVFWVFWITLTTLFAQLPEPAWIKWDVAWKSISFGIFLGFVLRSRQRIEVALFFIVLSVGVITITGGLKTLGGGGGYGTLNLLVRANDGLYEGSTISCVAVALVPLILYLFKHNTLFPRSLLFKLGTLGLIASALLVPIGTETRTGLVCLALLGFLLFLKSNRKLVTMVVIGVIAVSAVPFLPKSFTHRMGTIKSHDQDESASTRVAVWTWTIHYAATHPLGGGFGAYRLNSFEYDMKTEDGKTRRVVDKGRAFHSAYFETLGEQGYVGLGIYLSLALSALLQLQRTSRRFKIAEPEDAWIRDLANALFQTIIIYMAGSAFVGIAYQTTFYLLLAICVALFNVAAQRKPETVKTPARPALRPAFAR